MNFFPLPYGFAHGWGTKGISVDPAELPIFEQYMRHHNIAMGYANFGNIIRRIRSTGTRAIFWYDGRRLHYFSAHSNPPRQMSITRFNMLYEEAVDVSDILDLL